MGRAAVRQRITAHISAAMLVAVCVLAIPALTLEASVCHHPSAHRGRALSSCARTVLPVWSATRPGKDGRTVRSRRPVSETLGSTDASVPPPLPCDLYGTVTVDHARVPDGTSVTAWISGIQVAHSTTVTYEGESVYSVSIPGDDPDTPGTQGGVHGDTIVLRVGNLMASPTATWRGASSLRHDIIVLAAPVCLIALPLIIVT